MIHLSEKAYVRLIEEGFSYYKRCLDAKSSKNKISHGKKALKSLEKAVEIAQKLKLKTKIELINDYLSQLNMILAISHSDQKDPSKIILYFQSALKYNLKTPKGSKQNERAAIISVELAKLCLMTKNVKLAIKYAESANNVAKQLGNEDFLDILMEINPIYIQALSLKHVESSYKNMLKLAKKSKRKEIKAEVYFRYGKYSFEIRQKYSDSKLYLEKSITLYGVIHKIANQKFVEGFLNSHFDKDGNPIKNEKKQ